ncbi:hypothetical protein K432DRAFT_60124 [Lepidopterella palustris CBS 459.81]|uniref:Cytochrome b561 domain-containing protein n=1 Tax=Lepidopterella palustris CBS 459.81 TaxID=1314670 RepID=A0A8E2E9H8_9PEZI|nr:hypothetical protein K432DRAFT_60124 [Lepidopterella palustris CBS 459.81]
MAMARIPHLQLIATLLLASTVLAQDAGPPTSPSSGGEEEDSGSEAFSNRVVIAHGICMGLAFAIFFPLGAAILRALNFGGLVWFHAGWQIFTYCIAIAGLGLGIWIADTTDQWVVPNGHPIIGIIVVAILFLQPVGGLVHHFIFRKHQKGTVWGVAHRWTGRMMLLLGAINGGLGLMLSDNTVKGEIAYGVLAAFFFLLWGVSLFIDQRQKKNAAKNVEPQIATVESSSLEKKSHETENGLSG